jgi:putative hydrolase of the HAD superfamily
MDVLKAALDHGAAGRELDRLIDAFGLPATILPDLIARVRTHVPSLRLPRVSARVLAALKPSWRLGILTNGPAAVQSAKVRALKLEARVDAVVYASEHGSGAGKPEPEGFHVVAAQLDLDPSRVIFVGDDERCDVLGAAAVGMRTIRLTAWVAATSPSVASVVLPSLARVPEAAAALLEQGPVSHAA